MRTRHSVRGPNVPRSVYVAAIVIGSIIVIVLQVRWMSQQKPKFPEGTYQQYAKIIDLQTVKVFCDYCEGSGLVRDPASPDVMAVCPVCDGLGVHHIRFVKDSDVLCPDCRGLGRVPGPTFDQAQICARCDGRGLLGQAWDKLAIPVQKVVCDYCDGRGVLRNPDNPVQLDMCPICFGRGSHIVRRLDAHDELCPGCGGMGRLYDAETDTFRTCRLCGGRGISVAATEANTGASRTTTTH